MVFRNHICHIERNKIFFLSHQPSIFQEHAVQRCQSRKPKGCGDGKRRAKLENRRGKDNMHLSFSTSCQGAKKIHSSGLF